MNIKLSIEDICDNLINIINKFTSHIFYIGQTDDLKRRLKEHYRDKRSIQIIGLYKNNKSIIDYIEQYLINTYHRNFNCMNKLVSTTYKKLNNFNIDNNNLNDIIIQKNNIYPNIDNVFNNQWVYILFKTRIDINDDNYKLNTLYYENYYIEDVISNKNKINYQQYDDNIIININDNISINTYIDNIINNLTKSNEELTDEFYNLLIRLNPYVLQNIYVYKYFSFKLSDNYNKDKMKIMNKKNITDKNIICIKKGQKSDIKRIGKILCKFYKTCKYNHINYNHILYFYKFWKSKYNCLIVYFYN